MKKLVCLLTLNVAVLIASAQIPATTKAAFFKDWHYTPTGVFGLVKLDNVSERSYYKIVKIDALTTKVYRYNAAAVQTGMTTLSFVNGKITQIADTDQWGATYEVTKFAIAGPDQFIITRKSYGKNDFLPCKTIRTIYKNGLLTEIRFLDFNNKVSPNSDGIAIVKYKNYTDKDRYSRLNETSYFDENNQPVISQSEDCHKLVYEYDQRCNLVSSAFYGMSNEPITNRRGEFKNKNEYDSNDRVVKSTSYGINNEPVVNSYGVAGSLSEFKNGLVSKWIFFDEHFKTISGSAAWNAIFKFEYDEKGNETKRSYFDENEQATNPSGVHTVTSTYDPLNMLTSKSYYDKYGNRASNPDDIHKYVYVKDDKGRTIQTAYYDINNAAIKEPIDEVFMVKYKYDEQGRQVSESYWQNSTTKMVKWNGSHEEITKYNDDGLETEYAFYDENGKLFVSTSGYSRVLKLYASNAKMSERKYLNGNDCIMRAESFVNGFCSVKFSYDNKGRINNIRYFDDNGSPVNATSYVNQEDLTFHRIEFIYTGNRITEQRLYLKDSDTPGKIIDCLNNNYINTDGVTEGYTK